jgi:NADPH-dependent glutamate synthase beta subunit-like oxidoreductase
MNLLEALSDNIVVDRDKCIYCGVCVETCILDNLRLKLAPCSQACPLGVNCQGYVQLVARGQDEEALRVLEEKLPFPEILSRLCSQPCEDSCHHKKTSGQAVNIRGLKRYLTERYERQAPPVPAPATPTGKTVAVVGAGPAGLTAAYDLRRQGQAVVVFEAESEPGGMLRWAVPEFRLPRRILERELGRLVQLGVRFECGAVLGQDVSLGHLTSQYDAVLIATGCSRPQTLGIVGEDAADVRYALPFLKAARAGEPPVVGRKVVVIGGGDVAVDCAQTALRLGAAQVAVISLEAESALPAHPNVVGSAKAEGIIFRGSWGPQEIVVEDGRIQGVRLKKCISVLDADFRFMPVYDVCQTDVETADTVLIAIGQKADLGCLAECGIDSAQGLACDPLTLETSLTSVFAAGDVGTGPSSVVHAMAGGRRAAESIWRYLRGEDLRFGRSYAGPYETEFAIDTSRASAVNRSENPLGGFKGRGDFNEIEMPFTEESARREAARCYSCGEPFGKYRTCWFCLPCEVECPKDALWVEIPYLLR